MPKRSFSSPENPKGVAFRRDDSFFPKHSAPGFQVAVSLNVINFRRGSDYNGDHHGMSDCSETRTRSQTSSRFCKANWAQIEMKGVSFLGGLIRLGGEKAPTGQRLILSHRPDHPTCPTEFRNATFPGLPASCRLSDFQIFLASPTERGYDVFAERPCGFVFNATRLTRASSRGL